METQCSSRVPLSFTTDSIKHKENSSEKIISHYEPLILEKYDFLPLGHPTM